MADSEVVTAQLVERLTAEALGKTVEIGGETFATRPVYSVKKAEPEPETVKLQTLRGFAEYVKAIDIAAGDGAHYATARGPLSVIIDSPLAVRCVTDIFGGFNQKVELARANAVISANPIVLPLGNANGTWSDPETFNIVLLSLFAPTPERAEMLALVGNIKWEGTQTTADDGFTSIVATKVGLSMGERTAVKNPWMLTAPSAFSEVTQPEGPYILRTRGGGDRPKGVVLFEVADGQRRLAAIANVKAYLVDALPGVPVYG